MACASPFAPDLADGEHTLRIRQTDPSGNVSTTAEYAWVLDTAAPEAPVVVSGPTGTTDAPNVRFEWTAEPGAVVECRLDGGPWVPCPLPLALHALGLGAHALELRATDAAGNLSAIATARWTLVKHTDPPIGNTPGTIGNTPGSTGNTPGSTGNTPGSTGNTPGTTGNTPGTIALEASLSRQVSMQGDQATVGCLLDRHQDHRLPGAGLRQGVRARPQDRHEPGRGRLAPGTRASLRPRAGSRCASASIGRVVATSTASGACRRRSGSSPPTVTAATCERSSTLGIVPTVRLVVPNDGLFASGSAWLGSAGRRYLSAIAGTLNGAKTVRCVGHTDAIGPAATNLAVCSALSGQGGVRLPPRTRRAGCAPSRERRTKPAPREQRHRPWPGAQSPRRAHRPVRAVEAPGLGSADGHAPHQPARHLIRRRPRARWTGDPRSRRDPRRKPGLVRCALWHRRKPGGGSGGLRRLHRLVPALRHHRRSCPV